MILPRCPMCGKKISDLQVHTCLFDHSPKNPGPGPAQAFAIIWNNADLAGRTRIAEIVASWPPEEDD